jgi:hypothetical protein
MAALASLAFFSFVSCADPSAPAPSGGSGGVDGDPISKSCARPGEGCGCEPGAEPVECYPDPLPGDGAGELLCRIGTRTCRDGRWSSCEDIETYTFALPKGLGSPGQCNPCDPDCVRQASTPNDQDITTENSSNVVYTSGPPAGLTVPFTVDDVSMPDSDGDGVPDVADACNGPGFRAPCDGKNTVASEGFFFLLPPGQTGSDTYPPLTLKLTTVDYYVLMDTTNSMVEEISQLQEDLTSGDFTDCNAHTYPGVLGAIRCKLPNTAFGVGGFRDYPYHYAAEYECDWWGNCWYTDYNPYDYQLVPYFHLLDMSTDFSLAQTSVNLLSTQGNTDWPECDSQALYAMATGRGLGPWLPTRTTCANGGFGYPCFRPNSIPVILVITDAPFKNGPNNISDFNYGTSGYGTPDGNDVPASALDLPPATTTDVHGLTVQECIDEGDDFDLGDLTNRSVTVLGTTADSNISSNADYCSGSARRAPYFRFTLSAKRTIRIDTNGTEFDTILGLLGSNKKIVSRSSTYCNDDRPSNQSAVDPTGGEVYPHASYLRITNLPAGTYYIALDGYSSADIGAFQVRVRNESASGSLVASDGTPQRWSAVVDALNSIGAKTIGVAVCGKASGDAKTWCDTTQSDLRALGTATGSVSSITGKPFVYLVNADGTGLSSTVVDATMALANQLRLDVGFQCVDNPSTPVNECAVFAVSGTPAGGSCPSTCTGGRSGQTCLDCAPGTDLTFNVNVQNVGVTQTNVPQVFTFDVRLMADGLSELSRLPVTVVVPPIAEPEPSSGYFETIYASSERCMVPNQRADWGTLSYVADVPAGSQIDFELRTAQTEAALATATPVVVPWPAPNPIDVGEALLAGGQLNNQLYLSIRSVLRSDGVAAPTLSSFEMVYHCFDYE